MATPKAVRCAPARRWSTPTSARRQRRDARPPRTAARRTGDDLDALDSRRRRAAPCRSCWCYQAARLRRPGACTARRTSASGSATPGPRWLRTACRPLRPWASRRRGVSALATRRRMVGENEPELFWSRVRRAQAIGRQGGVPVPRPHRRPRWTTSSQPLRGGGRESAKGPRSRSTRSSSSTHTVARRPAASSTGTTAACGGYRPPQAAPLPEALSAARRSG